EYIDSAFTDNVTSASTALFYPVYPGNEITTANEEDAKHFYTTAKKRIASANREHTSMSLTKYASIFARLGDGETALDIISTVTRAMAMNNLVFSATDWRGMGVGNNGNWAQYTVESNMNITGALQEMLVQSDSNAIRILPALPDALPKGEISGLQTRTGVEVTSLSWDKRKGTVLVKLKSRRAVKIDMVLPEGAKRFICKPAGGEKIDYETGKVSGLSLAAGKATAIEIRL
ncbi:MAG: hypothetical protein K2L51_05660, partial [Clostridiales bacterium]|nr:hypothetical protein [Clostridiales bacterium]